MQSDHCPADLVHQVRENWPTPTARDWKSGAASEATLERNARPLSEIVQAEERKLWPTPTAQGGTGYQSGTNRDTWRPTLDTAAKLAAAGIDPTPVLHQTREDVLSALNWPTPTATDSRGSRNATSARQPGSLHHDGRTLLDEVILDGGPAQEIRSAEKFAGGSLNPAWVEQLQGLPAGWTDPENLLPASAMPWLYRWPARPGEAQHPWEAPRVATGVKNRPARLKALGNAVVPVQAMFAGLRLIEIIEGL